MAFRASTRETDRRQSSKTVTTVRARFKADEGRFNTNNRLISHLLFCPR